MLESLSSHLSDVFADRLRQSAGDVGADAVQDLRLSAQEFTAEQLELLTQNLHLLRLLSGHRGSALRKLAQRASSPAARYVSDLYQWSVHASTRRGSLRDSPLFSSVPSLLKVDGLSAEQAYERLKFAELHPHATTAIFERQMAEVAAQSLELPEADAKWTDMVEPLFTGPEASRNVEAMLLHVGFIPSEVYTKRKFMSLQREDVERLLATLRELENTDLKEEARLERTKAIKYLFLSGKALEFKGGKSAGAVTLDSNGIFINLPGIHSHVPYGLLDRDFTESLVRDGWLTSGQRLEVRSQSMKANSDFTEKSRIDEQQLESLAKAFGIEAGEGRTRLQRICEMVLKNPDEFSKKVFERKLVMPDALVQELLRRHGFDGAYAAFRFGEAIAANITGENLQRKTKLLSSYDILHEKDKAYEARSRVLNDPGYYNAVKVARLFLERPLPPDAREEFAVLRGDYKKARTGDQHAFVEVLYRGNLARILVNLDKHLETPQRTGLELIPRFSREQYERVEDALRTFHYFSSTLEQTRKVLDTQPANWRKRFSDYAETLEHFILSNVTEFYSESGIVDLELRTNRESFGADSARQLVAICDRAKEVYSRYLYAHVQAVAEDGEREFPEITKSELILDEAYLAGAKESCVPYGYNEDLCRSGMNVRVVQLDFPISNPSETIPYHVEEAAVDALGLDRNRPLINVIGGAKKLGQETSLQKFGEAVEKVAHTFKANVGVPGTQSGIGVVFGNINRRYKDEFGHLPRQEQAHFFAISPGKNCYFEGNEFAKHNEGEERYEEVYAVTPVDSIVTPQMAGWKSIGVYYRNSPYLNHIAIMEALYARMSKDQPRVMVVGNGGFYSICEINESLKNGFGMILIKDTGRFAEVAALLMEDIDSINEHAGPEDFYRQISEIVSSRLDVQTAGEFLKKDFGTTFITADDHQVIYREYFVNFIKLAKQYRNRIMTTSFDNLDKDLKEYLARNGRT